MATRFYIKYHLWMLLCYGRVVVTDHLAYEPKHLLSGPLQFAEP